MALIDYRATTIFRGFIINAIVTALFSAIIIELRVSYESKGAFKWLYESIIPPGENPGDPRKKIIITFFNGFAVSMFVYFVLYFITGFGGGMIVPSHKVKFF